MAMTAAHFQTGADPAERAALLWLEDLKEAPTVRAGNIAQRTAADGKSAVARYVPVNDKAGPAKGMLQSAPLARDKHARTFAQGWLAEETVYFAWAAAEPPAHLRGSLDDLCGKVTRMGQSASLVHAWVAEPQEMGEPNWTPDDHDPAVHLRLPARGTLQDLERRYNQAAIEEYGERAVAAVEADSSLEVDSKTFVQKVGVPPVRLRPAFARYQGYALAVDQVCEPLLAHSVFSSNLIVRQLSRKGQRDLDLLCVLALTKRWREALLSQSNDLSAVARGMISGHDSAGSPMQGPHLCFVPLAFVGSLHADGRLLGMGISLPDKLPSAVRQEILTALGRVERLVLGPLGTVRVGPILSAPAWNLQSTAWTGPTGGATHWSTVTPIAFDRHPRIKDRSAYQREIGAMVVAACEATGLPAPTVAVTSISAHTGVPPAQQFPMLRRKDQSERRHAHATLIFDEPVRGPILLGAGRYRGYGLCRPISGVAGAADE
jgi:CRISPR-associated protein Csb2